MEELIGLLFEVILQLLCDVLLDTSLRSRYPAIRIIGSTVLAVIAALFIGTISLYIHREHFIQLAWLRVLSLSILPILNGIFMVKVGTYFSQKNKPRGGYEHFIPGFAFSLIFGLLRFFGGI
jgi:hypothetical protein